MLDINLFPLLSPPFMKFFSHQRIKGTFWSSSISNVLRHISQLIFLRNLLRFVSPILAPLEWLDQRWFASYTADTRGKCHPHFCWDVEWNTISTSWRCDNHFGCNISDRMKGLTCAMTMRMKTNPWNWISVWQNVQCTIVLIDLLSSLALDHFFLWREWFVCIILMFVSESKLFFCSKEVMTFVVWSDVWSASTIVVKIGTPGFFCVRDSIFNDCSSFTATCILFLSFF